MGAVTITSYWIEGESRFIVDQGKSDEPLWEAAIGDITSDQPIIVVYPTTSEVSVYTLSFIMENQVGQGGEIRITIPEQIEFDQTEITQGGNCSRSQYTCTLIDSRILVIQVNFVVEAGIVVEFGIGGVMNPRSTGTYSGLFRITTHIGGYEIGAGELDLTYEITEAFELTRFQISPSNQINGRVNAYTFSLSAVSGGIRVPLQDGD